ncbi:MAG: ABC transporter permease [Actinomycetota bacterium]|nr:ABC transporter permease [Actinomycetota bacterium]
MSVLRDIFRRKARSILTITGIGVGVFALVVLGAAAENSNVYVKNLTGYYDDVIVVVEKNDANLWGMTNGNRPVSVAAVDEIRAYPGVRTVSRQVNLLLESEYMSAIPPMVLSMEAGGEDYASFALAEGRGLKEGERGVAIRGSDIAKQLEVAVGDTTDIRDEEFDVVGVMDRTYVNLVDSAAYVPLADAQQLYFASLPEAFQAGVKPEDMVLQMNVYVEPGEDTDAIAEELQRDIEGIHATGPDEMMKTVNNIIALFNTFVWTISAIALIVGGLSIVNTMTMSVSERTREIGVKRALGASRWRIARDVLSESAVIGGLGGLGGLAVGGLTVLALNSAMIAATGTTALVLTGRLAVGAVVFAVVLGTIGGLYPARYASRLEPATALAYE